MKAIHVTAIGAPEVLKLVDVDVPEVGPGMVRVRNQAIAINFHDIGARRLGEPGLTPPFIPGTDFAGLVDAVGEGVDDIKVGDRILGIQTHGAYAEMTSVPAFMTVPIPDDISFEQAASCPVAGLTAHFLLRENGVTADTTVVAYAAAGSNGCFLGGLLRKRGARGIGLVSTAAKAEIAKRAGWSDVIIYRDEDMVEGVAARTEGRGVDLVLDSVAGPEFKRSFDMAAVGGTVVLYGRSAGELQMSAITEGLLTSGRNLGLRTYFLGTTLLANLPSLRPAFELLFDAWRAGELYVPLESVPLAQAADAHARIEGQQTTGKVLLVP